MVAYTNWLSCMTIVICTPRLRLECEEYTNPSIFIFETNEYTTILPYSIVFSKIPTIPLIHMNIMNASTRRKTKIFIFFIFSFKFFSVSINCRFLARASCIYLLTFSFKSLSGPFLLQGEESFLGIK